MLVSGTMSESETTSSLPDRLAELSKAPSPSKLKHKKDQDCNTMTKTTTKSLIQSNISSCFSFCTCEMNPGQGLCLLTCALPPLQNYREKSESEHEKIHVKVRRWNKTTTLSWWSFTVEEERWRQFLCCLVMRWTGWLDSQQGFLLAEGSLEQGQVYQSVLLSTKNQYEYFNTSSPSWA